MDAASYEFLFPLYFGLFWLVFLATVKITVFISAINEV